MDGTRRRPRLEELRDTGPVTPGEAGGRAPRPWLHSVLDVEAGEGRALAWAFLANFCLLGAWYAMRPLRETFGVSAGEDLPWLFSGTFVASLVFIPLYWLLVARLGRRRLAAVFYHGSALCLVAFYLLFATLGAPGAEGAAPAAAVVGGVFFVWASTYVLFANALFWSVLVDLHGSASARRLFGLVFAGGTAGGLCSSAVVGLFAEGIGVAQVFWMPVVLLELAVLFLGRLDRVAGGDPGARPRAEGAPPSAAPVGGRLLEGLRLIARSPYMLGICAYMFFATFFGTVLYFEQQGIVRSSVADPAERTQLFSWINFAVQALTVVGQGLVTARFLRRLGLVAALVLLPLFFAAGLTALGVWTVLPVLVVLQVLQRSIGFSLAKPSKEILYTVVGREAKYKSKGFIDTIVYRGGDATSGWAFHGMQALGLGLSGIAFAVVPLCVVWAALCAALGRRQEALARDAAPPEALAPEGGPAT
jgi:ATP:ADP antiporter, AAA family